MVFDFENAKEQKKFPSSSFLLKTSKEYSLYICQHRAIPKISDGLKPVQRMALWVLRNKAEKIKTMALGGLLAFEKLYNHGDVSCNDAISMLAAPYKNNVPLIEGLGHFGSRMKPAAWGAPRYTEVRRSKIAEALLYKDLDIVPLEDNYDGSNQQPKHFLPLIPLVLLNGVSGIAIGWSTNILPRNLRDLIEATKSVLLDKPIKQLIPSYKKYDITVTNIGENKWELVGKAKVNGNSIQITELPPNTNHEMFLKRLIAMEENEQIRDYMDRSSKKIDITVRMPRLGQLETGKKEKIITTEKESLDFFKLREKTTERIVVVDWDGEAIRTYPNAEDVVRDFVKWRLGWYTTRYEYLRDRDSYELVYWKVLKILFDGGFTKRLGTFANKAALQQDVMDTLAGAFVCDVHTLERVVNLPTYRWTISFRDEVIKKIMDFTAIIKEYNDNLASPERIRDIYLKELDELKYLERDLDRES